MSTWASSSIHTSCVHKHAVGCLQLSSSVCCWCIQQYSSTPAGRLLLSINDRCRQVYPAAYSRYCWKCWEYWSSFGLPAQAVRPTSLDSLDSPSGISSSDVTSPAPDLSATQSSLAHPRRSHQRKSRHETIEKLREELQTIRDGIARILANLQTLSDTLSVYQPATQIAQHHNVSPGHRRMDEMDTSPENPGPEAMAGSGFDYGYGFDHTLLQGANQGSGFGEARPHPIPYQANNLNPAAPNYSLPNTDRTRFTSMDPSVGPVYPYPWQTIVVDRRRLAVAQTMGPQHAPDMGAYTQVVPNMVPQPQGYSLPPPHGSVPRVSNTAPESTNGRTDSPHAYSMYTLRDPVDQHSRETLGSPRRSYHLHRRPRRNHNRSASTPKRLDDMDDGRPEAKESSELTVKLDCKICMTQLIDTVMFPCGHAALCRWCADLHIPPARSDPSKPSEYVKCPLCRVPVERKYRIFLS